MDVLPLAGPMVWVHISTAVARLPRDEAMLVGCGRCSDPGVVRATAVRRHSEALTAVWVPRIWRMYFFWMLQPSGSFQALCRHCGFFWEGVVKTGFHLSRRGAPHPGVRAGRAVGLFKPRWCRTPELLCGPADPEFNICRSRAPCCITIGKQGGLGFFFGGGNVCYFFAFPSVGPRCAGEAFSTNLTAWFLKGEQLFPSSFPSRHCCWFRAGSCPRRPV